MRTLFLIFTLCLGIDEKRSVGETDITVGIATVLIRHKKSGCVWERFAVYSIPARETKSDSVRFPLPAATRPPDRHPIGREPTRST